MSEMENDYDGVLLLIRYTIFSGVFQFILPLVVISIIYSKIYFFLKKRRMPNHSHQQKQKRTNTILISISVIFSIRYINKIELGGTTYYIPSAMWMQSLPKNYTAELGSQRMIASTKPTNPISHSKTRK